MSKDDIFSIPYVFINIILILLTCTSITLIEYFLVIFMATGIWILL